ncbi:MAG: ATP synthase F1 subunit epsilon [Clostridia bacterium]|nr:ATP synthase F1 subunit epsilon [Clostridia bacterium]
MANLHLDILCPDGEIFSGEAKSILVTTVEGQIQLLAGHADLIAALGTGIAKLTLTDGSERLAAASGGFITADKSGVRVIATTFEFAENIDLQRAKRARERAEEQIRNAKDERETEIARAKLMRAICRINAAS